MEQVRCFIAVELPDEVKTGLDQLQAQIKSGRQTSVKWVNPYGIHLTLKFLGNVNLELIETIKKSIDQLAKEHERFKMDLGQLRVFPRIEHPRVI